jgi:phospholipid-binding lipoprotein MlaA
MTAALIPVALLLAAPVGHDVLPFPNTAPMALATTEVAEAAPGNGPVEDKAPLPDIQTSDDPLQSEIVVTAHDRASPVDPLASVNVVTFDVAQVADRLMIAPVSKAYKGAIPLVARDGITNALNNLDEPIVFANFILQGKPLLAARTVLRFAINSTVGLGGLIDVAKRKPFKMARRSNGLADTLGYYGVKTGPYLFLPLIGSTTIRDMVGRLVDFALVPRLVGTPFNKPAFSLPKSALSAVDERVHADDQGRSDRHMSADPYVAVREYYLTTRAEEILILRKEPGLRPRLKRAQEERPMSQPQDARGQTKLHGDGTQTGLTPSPSPSSGQ